ncbi:hypothetical protein VB780_03330 [Leptolyngbya sp. CCNP1308]|uniref:hypothetical protein n=1 Tax=Leptolyngbya sp. CCNP1308 TaxID=3110255 RepID=UPI002B1ED160|nr:hypothetical protein [Leptolyngbya sp. CCNP1308]MEA5447586.1 hypothetical protein [Leptolyngbya sp. CCNP1308]
MAAKTLTYQGKTQTYAEWAAETNIKEVTLIGRVKAGWSVERTLTEPATMGRRKKPTDASLIGLKIGPNKLTVKEKLPSSDTYVLTSDDGQQSWLVHGYRLRNPKKLTLKDNFVRARYYVKGPDNVEVGVVNLNAFCEIMKLDFNIMLRVAEGQQATHKGWKCCRA